MRQQQCEHERESGEREHVGVHGDARQRDAVAERMSERAHAAALRSAGMRSSSPATSRSATPITTWPLTTSG